MIEIQEIKKENNLITFSFHIKQYIGEVVSILLRKYVHRFYPIKNAYAIHSDVEIMSNEKLLSLLSEFDIFFESINSIQNEKNEHVITSKMLSVNNKLDKVIYQSNKPFSFEFLFQTNENIFTPNSLSIKENNKNYNTFIAKSKIWNVMYSVEHGFQNKNKELLDRVNFEISGSIENIDVESMISEFRNWIISNI